MAEKYKDIEETDINRDVIKRSIKNIVSIPKGTIPGKPDKGSDITKYLFRDLDALDLIDLADYVRVLVVSNEKRVTKVKVDTNFTPEYHRLTISVSYQIIPEEETDFVSLVFKV